MRSLDRFGRSSQLVTVLLILAGLAAIPFVVFLLASSLLAPQLIFGGLIASIGGIFFLTRTQALQKKILLVSLIFLIMTYPLARIVVGPVPIYLVDILVAVALLMSMFIKAPKWQLVKPLPALILAYIILTGLSILYEIWFTGVFLQPIYMFLRHFASIVIALLIPMFVCSHQEIKLVTVTVIIGTAISVAITVFMAIPLPNNPVPELVATLNPVNIDRFDRLYLKTLDTAGRGHSLVGQANATGVFIMVGWLFALGMYRSIRLNQWRWWLLGVLFFGLVGMALTYSRSVYLGLVVVLTIIFFGRSSFRLRIALVTILLILGGLFRLGQQQDYFQFDWVYEKFATTLDDPTATYTDRERIEAYLNFFPVLLADPHRIFVGDGVSLNKLKSRQLFDRLEGTADTFSGQHATWASIFYRRGLLAMLVHIAILVIAFQKLKQRQPDDAQKQITWRWLPRTMRWAFLGMAPAWLFTHFFNTSIQGQAFLFLLVGLAMATVNTSSLPEPGLMPKEQKRPSLTFKKNKQLLSH